jgi:hypothetical protein
VIPADSRGTALFATSVGIVAVIHNLARERSAFPPSRDSALSPAPDSNMAQ